MRVNNEIPKEVFSCKLQEVEERIAELEQQMMQYGDVKPATDEDVNGKLEGFSIQSLLTWCRILPLNRRIDRREKSRNIPCGVQHFLIKYSYGCCHNGRRLVLLRRDCDPPIT